MEMSAYTNQSGESEGYARSAAGARAGFWERFGAWLLDGLILAVPYVLLSVAVKGSIWPLLMLVSTVAYFVYFEGRTGQTPGKRAVGIRVVGRDGETAIGYGRAFVRLIGRYLSALPIYLGYLWMLWDKDKQCWHDKLASDIVVPAP
jgi:uncharacterized RDD family membrane protein YckC